MKIFFLDDNMERHTSFRKCFPNANITFVKTAQEAIEILTKDLNYDLITLDHDLGDRIFVDSNDENTGYQVAKFLKDKDIKCQIIIHSCNPGGAKNMMSLLPQADYMPVFWLNPLIKIK
jgi:CheY-like chemotaxis protein